MTQQSTYDVIIIGGGLSGLSAGVHLTANGAKVLVLEKNIACGGRATSFYHLPSQSLVDAGQHLMMGCYTETREFLRLIETKQHLFLQPSLSVNYLTGYGTHQTLKFPLLPVPLNFFAGLINFSALNWHDRSRLLHLTTSIILPDAQLLNDALSVEQWLTRYSQSPSLRKYLWDVLCIGAMNDVPANVSAAMFVNVLRTIFFGSKDASSFMFSTVPLKTLFVDPAIDYIKTGGGEVLTGKRVQTVDISNTIISSIQTMDNQFFSAKHFIIAVPWFSVEKLFRTKLPFQLPSLTSSPIVNIHLWYDKPITDYLCAAVVDSKIIQWIFFPSNIFGESSTSSLFHLSCVVSAAESVVNLHSDEILRLTIKDLMYALPQISDAKLIFSKVIKEKRATFRPAPGVNQLRPSTRTSVSNLFLAGDWTQTQYPATIEGAIKSGKQAALEVLCSK